METKIRGTMAGHEARSPDSPWLDLAAGIVKQAAEDYIRVLRKLWSRNGEIGQKRKLIVEKAELEEFFHSGWYEELTEIDPDRLMFQCRSLAKEKEKDLIERQNRKRIQKQLLNAEEHDGGEEDGTQ